MNRRTQEMIMGKMPKASEDAQKQAQMPQIPPKRDPMLYPGDYPRPPMTVDSIISHLKRMKQGYGGDCVISEISVNGQVYPISRDPKIWIIRKGRGVKRKYIMSLEWDVRDEDKEQK